MDAGAAALVERATQLRAEVASHKLAIRHRREALCAAATALTELETELRRRGVGLEVLSPQPGGVGVIHGRTRSRHYDPR